MTLTPVQRAMLQLQRHADFKDPADPHDQAKANAYRHALQVVGLFTGEKLPATPQPLAEAKATQGQLSLA